MGKMGRQITRQEARNLTRRTKKKGRLAMKAKQIPFVAPIQVKNLDGQNVKRQDGNNNVVEWVMSQRDFLRLLMQDPLFLGETQGYAGMEVLTNAQAVLAAAPDGTDLLVEGELHARLLRSLKDTKNFSPVIQPSVFPFAKSLMDAKDVEVAPVADPPATS